MTATTTNPIYPIFPMILTRNTNGLPIMVQRIADSIFQRLPAEDAPKFFAALPGAIGCDGKDLSCVGWQFLVQALRNMPPQPAKIQAVVDPVIAGLELLAAGGEWPAADAADAVDAANAADAAFAFDVAGANAAFAGANAAFAFAFAADAAADAASASASASASAADAAAQQRDLLLQLLSDAPVVEGCA